MVLPNEITPSVTSHTTIQTRTLVILEYVYVFFSFLFFLFFQAWCEIMFIKSDKYLISKELL